MKYNPNQLLLKSQLLKKNQRKKVKKVLKEKTMKMIEHLEKINIKPHWVRKKPNRPLKIY